MLALFGITGRRGGTTLAYLTEALFLARATKRRHVHGGCWRPAAGDLLCRAAAIGLAVGNDASRSTSATLPPGLAAAALALALWLVLVALIAPGDLLLLLEKTARGLARRRSKRSADPVSTVASQAGMIVRSRP